MLVQRGQVLFGGEVVIGASPCAGRERHVAREDMRVGVNYRRQRRVTFLHAVRATVGGGRAGFLIRNSNRRDANTSGRARPEKVPSGPAWSCIRADPVAGPIIDPIRPAP